MAFGAALWHALTHGPAVSKSRQSAHAPRRNCAVYENVNFHQCSRPFRSGSVVCGFGWRTHRHTKHHCAAAAVLCVGIFVRSVVVQTMGLGVSGRLNAGPPVAYAIGSRIGAAHAKCDGPQMRVHAEHQLKSIVSPDRNK